MTPYTWTDYLTALILAAMILGSVLLSLHQGGVW